MERSNFISNIMRADLESGKHTQVVASFRLRSRRYLHIGHAKSICVNFGLGEQFGGLTYMRFDDTNPEKEEQEYVDGILRDVKWLGFDWKADERQTYASNYFDKFYEYALQLIDEGKAYVDSLSAEEMREYRGTLTKPGKDSPYRTRSVEENRKLFESMAAGEVPDGEMVLRVKIDMASPNMNMRDPAIYRIKRDAEHPLTGRKWKVYPMYDYAHALTGTQCNKHHHHHHHHHHTTSCPPIAHLPPNPLYRRARGITHSLCTLEFEDHRPLIRLGRPEPTRAVHAPTDRVLTAQPAILRCLKEELIKLVTDGHVAGWDDPRMPTLCGLRRRGVPPEALRLFVERTGVSKADNNIDYSVLEDCAREVLDASTPRAFAVIDQLR